MGRKIELELEIAKKDVDKRQTLTGAIDMNLILDGFRVTAGTYRVTIERVGPVEKPTDEPSST